MSSLPEQYVVGKFYQFSNKVKFHRSSNSYRGGCPSCHEGESWGTKTRLNYYLDQQFLCSYNCHLTWSPIQWIIEQTGLTYREIMKEKEEFEYFDLPDMEEDEPKLKKKTYDLPYNAINLSDDIQIRYYDDNQVVKHALKTIRDRRLDTAINRCKNFYISLDDYIHKNRLCIPFCDADGKIRFFQTRALYKEDEEVAKYLSKLNADKTVFGMNNIDTNLEYLFVFEGPIDSMFVKNGISMAGLHLSTLQNDTLNKYILHEKIWVLDNQVQKNEVYEKNMELINRGERIFIWPKKYKEFKDLNELCCKLKIDSVSPNFFIENSYKGECAKLNLSMARLKVP